MKKSLLFLALAAGLAGPASAATCTFLAKDTVCTFATDTTGGQAIYTNPTNLSNIGSGVVQPFLGLQANGTQGGVSTDSPIVNTLPLNDKRDNANTFTNTFSQAELEVFTIGGQSFYQFLLDTNEPSSPDGRLISIDTLRIWDAQSAVAQFLTNANVPSLASLDGLFPNLIYAMGIGNQVVMDGTLFSGSGLGYDLSVFVPVSAFAGVPLANRLIFGTGMGGSLDFAAASNGGFEEWAYVGRQVTAVPEPETYALFAAGLGALAFLQRRRKPKDAAK
jgi:hypothetical protein